MTTADTLRRLPAILAFLLVYSWVVTPLVVLVRVGHALGLLSD